MPIHDLSYRRYQGEREPPRGVWTVITSVGIMTFLRRRMFLAVLLGAWIPFVIYAARIYFTTNFAQAADLLPTNVKMFREFLDAQGFWVFIVTIFVGAGLIANDRRANALQIYLSKPLTRAEYVAGKLAILVIFLLLITWLPAMLLLLLQIVFSGSFAFARANLALIPSITVASFVEVLVNALMMLSLSSLSKSARFTGILYAGVALFSHAVFGLVSLITGGSRAAWISFIANLEQVSDAIFRLPPRYETPVPVCIVAIIAFIVIPLFILERRVRGVEVVT
jgi:ABC-2 type transport system permease protein